MSSAGLIVLWHIDANGKVKNAGTIPVSPMTMPHDFLVTSNHLILLLPPLNFSPSEDSMSFLDAHRWQPDQGSRVLVIDKNDFTKVRQYELPAQWVFHFGNAWEDNKGIIRFDAARADSPLDMIENFRAIMNGDTRTPAASIHYQYQIDTRSQRISEAPLLSMGIDSEFPVVDPRVSTRQNRYLTMLSSSKPAVHGSLTSVSRYDWQRDRLQTYEYPHTKMPEEHLYVGEASKRPEQGGWIIGTALDYANEQTELNIFEAERLEAGPVATATLPYALPLGFHGKFADATFGQDQG